MTTHVRLLDYLTGKADPSSIVDFDHFPESESSDDSHTGRSVGGIHIDERIGPCIIQLIRQGYSPRWSCQGGPANNSFCAHRSMMGKSAGYIALNDNGHGDIITALREVLSQEYPHFPETSGQEYPDDDAIFLRRSVQPGSNQPLASIYWRNNFFDTAMSALGRLGPAPAIVMFAMG